MLSIDREEQEKRRVEMEMRVKEEERQRMSIVMRKSLPRPSVISLDG